MGAKPKQRPLHPNPLCVDRDVAISMLGGQPWVLEALEAHGLVKPIPCARKVTIFDAMAVTTAYGKALAEPTKYFVLPAEKRRVDPRRAKETAAA